MTCMGWCVCVGGGGGAGGGAGQCHRVKIKERINFFCIEYSILDKRGTLNKVADTLKVHICDPHPPPH